MITTIDYLSWFDNKKKEMIASGRYLSEIKFLFKEAKQKRKYSYKRKIEYRSIE